MADLPAVRGSRFENAGGNIAYVGADKCSSCHVDETSTYEATAHASAFQLTDIFGKEFEGAVVVDAAAHRRYLIEPDLSQSPDGIGTPPPSRQLMWHRELLTGPQRQLIKLAEYPAEYTIGSGRFSRSYLMDIDGFLVQSPVTWYAARDKWGLSPGYERHNPGFERPVTLQCLQCHVGRVKAVPPTLQKFEILTHAIDCERCHGPAGLHVAKHAAAEPAGEPSQFDFDPTIVNPSRLTRLEQEDVCAQCHFHTGATIAVHGRRLEDFRPSLHLNDFCIHVGRKSSKGEMRVVGHVEQLRLSRCYLASEQLTCTTCHHPHQDVPPEEKLAYHRAKCLSCHAEDACGLPLAKRQADENQDNCVKCHMPQSPTDIPHFAFTHHRIGIHQPDQAPEKSAESTLVALDDVSHLPAWEQDRVLGLGYLQMLPSAESPEEAAAFQERALALLTRLRESGCRDAELDSSLARLHWRREPEQTISLAQAVLDNPAASAESRVTALFTLGSTYLDQEHAESALPYLKQATEARLYSEDWYLLSLCYQQLGRISEALKAAQQAAKLSPQIPQLQAHAGQLAEQAGEPKVAQQHFQRARQLEEALPRPVDR